MAYNYALITDDNNGSVPSRKGQGFFVVAEICGVMSWAYAAALTFHRLQSLNILTLRISGATHRDSRNFSATKGTIKVITNGILLTKISGDFWRACHNYNVGISVTHSPIKLDEEKIKSLAKEYDIDFEWFVSNSVKDFFYLKPIDLSGGGDYRKNFAGCVWSNRCIQLSHGRLYTCMFIPYVRHFNKRFSQNIEVTDKDSVNIYEERA